MKYMGSKNRIAKHILPIILKDRKKGQWYVEPFVGGANMIDKVEGNRIGADNNHYLIALLCAVANGWEPPLFVSEELWRDVKESTGTDKYSDEFTAFVRLGCSFGSDWNGGYARNVRKDAPNAELLNSTTKSYCRQSRNNLIKQSKNINGVDLRSEKYQDLTIPSQSIIYCDPPYAKTTGYKDGDFNHAEFWQKCREWCTEGYQVFISEYNAPDDFVCVWQQELSITVSNGAQKKAIEKLFIHESQINSSDM